MKKFVGKEVVIIGSHPWRGERGTVIKVETPNGVFDPALYVSLENGTDCYVFTTQHLKLF